MELEGDKSPFFPCSALMKTKINLSILLAYFLMQIIPVFAISPEKSVVGKYDCEENRNMAVHGRLPLERAEALESLQYCDSQKDISILLGAVESGNKRERLAALSSLSSRIDAFSVDQILTYYNSRSPDPDEQVLYLHILQLKASPDQSQKLEKIFLRGSTADHSSISMESLIGLQKIQSSRRLNGVIKALQSEDIELITAGFEGAYGFEDPELKDITENLLQSKNQVIQKAALNYYATLKSEQTLKTLIKLEKKGIHKSNAPLLWEIAEKRINETFPGTAPALTRAPLRIHEKPEFQSDVIGVLGKNDVVFVTIPDHPVPASIPEKHIEPDEWVEIEVGHGMKGWCRRTELTIYNKIER